MKWQGKTGLVWFTGVVEDRDDPLYLNRVRVRIYGIHTHEKQLISTPDLPWSQVLMPVTSPSLSGLGTTTHGLVEGSTVMGFWRDGLSMQDPVIMGSFIGKPQKVLRKTIGSDGGEEEIVRYPFRSTEFLGPGPVETLPNYTFPITFVSADAGTGVLADGAYTVTVASTSGSGTGLKLTMEISNNGINALSIENPGEGFMAGDTITFLDINGEDNGVMLTVKTVSKPEGYKDFPEGFQDPRLDVVAAYDENPDGPNPLHMSNRNYGLTLALDKSPRDQGSLEAINYPRESYIGTSDVNKLAQGWAGKPETSTDPANPFKLMTDDEAKLTLIDPNTGFFAYTTETRRIGSDHADYIGEDTTEQTIFVSYKDEIAAEGDLLSVLGTPAEHKIPQATAAWKKIKTDNNRKVQAKANVATDAYTDAYDYIYPNSVIENGGVGKTLFKGTAQATTAGGALLQGLAGPTLNKGDDEDRRSWVKPKYPFNHVYESESGHVIEIDDTPDYERINIFHRKGARIEINNKGEIHMIAAEGQDINIQGYNINLHDYGSGTFNIHSVGKILMNALGDGIKIITEGQTTLFSKGDTSVFSLLNTKIKALGKNIIG